MAFSVPTFNLPVNVFDGDIFPVVTPRLVTVGNLAMGRRQNWPNSSDQFIGTVTSGQQPILLLPSGTDVRDASTGRQPDFIECPAGSGRFYQIGSVEDTGKGFPNEYRVATIFKIFQSSQGTGSFPGLFWPTPIP
jgi:hypothetical protein